jgi:predicted metal-binding membrane protein
VERVSKVVPVVEGRLLRLTPQLATVALAGAAAWVIVLGLARGMGAMPGTMGLGLPAFTAVWTVMMTAMMLPSVAPVAAMYARAVNVHRTRRLAAFAAGYLLVWSLAAPLFYALAALVSGAAEAHEPLARAAGATIFVGAGAYQLSPLKDACLSHCRSPIAQLLHYASFSSRLRDVRVGIHHGSFCLACCWALMLVLVAAGLMNVLVMLILDLVIAVEKYSPAGTWFSRAVAVAAIVAGVASLWVPQLAPGIHGPV